MIERAVPQLTLGLNSYSAEDPGGWEHMFARARAADRAGIDSLMVSDHVVFGENLDEYAKPEVGGAKGGKQPTGPDGHWLEPLTTLSVVAGMTKRIRLRTQILLAALRRPVTLAKAAATLDVLSGGRLDLGVGVGWQREEYEAAGLTFDTRGRLLDHSLEVCQTLWRNQRASYSAPELGFDAIHQMPKPLQPGGVPFWIAGTLRSSTIRRVAHYGSGWIPWGADAANLLDSVPRLKDGVAAAGGNPDGLQIVGYMPREAKGDDGSIDPRRAADQIKALMEVGVTDFVLHMDVPNDEAAAEDLLSGIVTKFRETVGRS
ncbi:TIGR03619 family F420-dependent LLM class oxidoreductase [Sphingomonas montanisoli]|uniref:TIGR03619 family F420-dependent LLM class oxidoreductase n=1 Tax=Sphingomonas montanisoli TaxID=2606412 RepID=A0A5D9BX44_9SPHN|nr:TIGR03619 family F420-dependent LLM class oxidoreductase [Sphingomonas montanisoli]TZG24148.1 TIGR03619 family F420-dependent LLM class oxidoreductase [Sphingomonas montanisoli]